jgi:hypothetical protein
LSLFHLDRHGHLLPTGRTSCGGKVPLGVGVAFNQFALVANYDSGDITDFHIDRHGQLSLLGQHPAGNGPSVIAVAPEGFVAVGNGASNDLSLFHLGRDGVLRPVNGPLGAHGALRAAGDTFPLGGKLSAAAFAPDGRALFVAVENPGVEDRILGYDVTFAGGGGHREIDPASIALTPRSTTAGGYFVTGLVATDDRLFVATENAQGRDEIREYHREGTTLTLDAAVVTPSPSASYQRIAVSESDDPLVFNVLVTEYQSGWLRSIVFAGP